MHQLAILRKDKSELAYSIFAGVIRPACCRALYGTWRLVQLIRRTD